MVQGEAVPEFENSLELQPLRETIKKGTEMDPARELARWRGGSRLRSRSCLLVRVGVLTLIAVGGCTRRAHACMHAGQGRAGACY